LDQNLFDKAVELQVK